MEGKLVWEGAQEHKNTVEEVESTAVVSTVVQVAVKPISIRKSNLSKDRSCGWSLVVIFYGKMMLKKVLIFQKIKRNTKIKVIKEPHILIFVRDQKTQNRNAVGKDYNILSVNVPALTLRRVSLRQSQIPVIVLDIVLTGRKLSDTLFTDMPLITPSFNTTCISGSPCLSSFGTLSNWQLILT